MIKAHIQSRNFGAGMVLGSLKEESLEMSGSLLSFS